MFPVSPLVPECSVYWLLSSPAAPWGGCSDLNSYCCPFLFTNTSVQRIIWTAACLGVLWVCLFIFFPQAFLPEKVVCRYSVPAMYVFLEFLLPSSFYFSLVEFNQSFVAKAWSFRCFLSRSWVPFVVSVHLYWVNEEKMHIVKKNNMLKCIL